MIATHPHKSWHYRGYLPHFDGAGAVQVLTFRLADSLPRAVLDRVASLETRERYRILDDDIDRCRGSCILSDPACAGIVQQAFERFDGERYRLIAWVVMPNHVHVIIEQMPGHRLGDVIRSWKSYSARCINTSKVRRGALWAPDYFDRFVRNERHLENAIRYVEENPVKAGLAASAADWAFSSFRVRNGERASPDAPTGIARAQLRRRRA